MHWNQCLRFYNVVAADTNNMSNSTPHLHLRQIGLRHGILSPATQVMKYKDVVHKFPDKEETQSFISKILQGKGLNLRTTTWKCCCLPKYMVTP